MNIFPPKLEPGERIVVRHPPVWLAVLVGAVMGALATAPIVAGLSQGGDGAEGAIWPVLAAGAILLLVVLLVLGRWRILVTDRRVLVRQSNLAGAVESIPREDIETAHQINGTLFIEGKGRVISAISPVRFLGSVLKHIDPLYDNLKLRTPALRRKLAPGERVVLRLRRPLPAILAWVAVPVLPFAAMFLLLQYPEIINAWLGLFPGAMALLAVLALIILLQFSIDFAWLSLFTLFFDHWRIAITDRRVLVRRGLLGFGHDEIARGKGCRAEYDVAGGRLVLWTGSGKLAFRCGETDAFRIVAALTGTDPSQADRLPGPAGR